MLNSSVNLNFPDWSSLLVLLLATKLVSKHIPGKFCHFFIWTYQRKRKLWRKPEFCKSTFHIPANIPHSTSQIPIIPHPGDPVSRTSCIPNIPYSEHPTSRTLHIPNIPHPQNPASRISHIPNTPQPQHLTLLTYYIHNIPHNSNFIITFSKFPNTCEQVFKYSFNNIRI